MKKLITIILFIGTVISGFGQLFTGTVYDEQLQEPVTNALVRIEGTSVYSYTNANGEFTFTYSQIINAAQQGEIPYLQLDNKLIRYNFSQPAHLRIFNLLGKEMMGASGNEIEINLQFLHPGIYLMIVDQENASTVLKFLNTKNEIQTNTLAFYQRQNFNLEIEKDHYETGYFTLQKNKEANFSLKQSDATNNDYLTFINNLDDFHSIEAKPLIPYFGEVTSVKFIYEINSGIIYYINTKLHRAHSYFAMDVLNYSKNNDWFNHEQYSNNPNRIYYPGTIDYFSATDKYVLQFFASDDISCTEIEMVYEKIRETSFFDKELYFYANTIRTQSCVNLPLITSDEIYSGQNYQCLNPQEAYGYLKKVEFDKIEEYSPGRHDIIVLNGIPVDVPVVAGIITTEFQTPLSHINVLSINRKTPNMALKDGWDNDQLNSLMDQLIYLHTDFENFEIRKATIEEAETFWASREPQSPNVLQPNITYKELIDAENLSVTDVNLVGGKAANFGELLNITTSEGPVPVPEGAFAIPFYYYQQHIQQNGLDSLLISMLANSEFKTNVATRREMLLDLQNKIIHAPIDPELVQTVEEKMSANGTSRCRFRSSTNAEDIEGFNGAGLYDSKTGILYDEDEPVENAIREVWASLWNFKAFEEREYFLINQTTVAMGILVHRSFPNEAANGVLITKNIYRDGLACYTINSQFDEISIVNPEGNWVPEQVLYYTFSSAQNNPIDYISFSNVPWYKGQTVLTAEEYHLLYKYCHDIQYHYSQLGINHALDIEFKVDRTESGERKIYIKQCRVFND